MHLLQLGFVNLADEIFSGILKKKLKLSPWPVFGDWLLLIVYFYTLNEIFQLVS